jgi:hypothetical protein
MWINKQDEQTQTDVMQLIANFGNFVDAAKHLYYGCTQKVSLRYLYLLGARGGAVG